MKKIACLLFAALFLFASCSSGVSTKVNDTSVFVCDDVLANVMYTFAFKADEKSLACEIDKALYEMYQDGAAVKICEAWLGENKLRERTVMDEPADDGSLKRVHEAGVLNVAYIDSYYPMSWEDAYGTVVGMEVDLIAEAARRIGLEAKFFSCDPETRENVLGSDKVDVAISCFEYTAEASEKFTLIDPYIETGLVLMSAARDSYTTMRDLRRKNLLVPKGSPTSIEYAKNCGEVFDKTTQAQTCSHGYYRVKEKRYDGMIVDQIFAEYAKAGHFLK